MTVNRGIAENKFAYQGIILIASDQKECILLTVTVAEHDEVFSKGVGFAGLACIA